MRGSRRSGAPRQVLDSVRGTRTAVPSSTVGPVSVARAVALLVAAISIACAGGQLPEGGDETSLDVRFILDESAFDAPEAPQFTVPFDVVSADMDLDGDPDLLVNWHNLARLELFENRDGAFVLLNPPGGDRSGLFETAGVTDLYAPVESMLERARAAESPGVYVWHEPDRRGDWHLYVNPAGASVVLTLRANRALTPRVNERFVVRRDEFEAELSIDRPLHFRVGVELVATRLVLTASVPVYAGAGLDPLGERADLWKDDPHGIAWVHVRGTPEPDLFIARGGLGGNLLPPHDPKVDRFFEYTGGDPLYADVRDVIPANYGRGRRVEWVDIDGDGVNELYVGNTGSPNALLVGDGSGGYRDAAAELGLDFVGGDTFAWLDLDDDGRDDLLFVDADGFGIAYNRGQRSFERAAGGSIGLDFPQGSEPVEDGLFNPLSLYVVDVDNDGRLDVWLAGHGEGREHALYKDIGAGFEEVSEAVGLGDTPLVNRMAFLDLENDGYLDAVTFGTGAVWLHNAGEAGFFIDDVDPEWALREFTSAAAVDVDDDRRVDVAMFGHRRMLARNRTTGGGSALRVTLRGTRDDPVGTVVTAVYANGMAHAQRYGSALATRYSQGLGPLHFGVPVDTSIERLEVRWPDGARDTRPVEPGESDIELRW